MAYQNKKGQPRERCMLAAQVLADEFGAKQADIARVMDCSQSTVSSWAKEVRYKKDIAYLETELEHAHEYALELAENLNLNDMKDVKGIANKGEQ